MLQYSSLVTLLLLNSRANAFDADTADDKNTQVL